MERLWPEGLETSADTTLGVEIDWRYNIDFK